MRKAHPGTIHLADPPLGAQHRHMGGHGVEDVAGVLALAVALHLRLAGRGQRARQAEEAGHAPGLVAQCADAALHPEAVAVLVVVVEGPVPLAAGGQLGHQRVILGVRGWGEALDERPAHHLLGSPPEEPGGRGIPRLHHPGRVREDGRVGEDLQQLIVRHWER